jgi:Mg-chelatase subunit ChlD
MNSDLTPNPRAELEARVTALLLGELSAEEAASLREMIAHDAELCRLRDRLSLTLDLLRETAATPVGKTPAPPAPLKLSPARRQKLLAQFKTIAPREFAHPFRRKISWLIPLAAAAAVVALFVLSRSTYTDDSTLGVHGSIDKSQARHLERRLADREKPGAAPALPPQTREAGLRNLTARTPAPAQSTSQIVLPQSGEQQLMQAPDQVNERGGHPFGTRVFESVAPGFGGGGGGIGRAYRPEDTKAPATPPGTPAAFGPVTSMAEVSDVAGMVLKKDAGDWAYKGVPPGGAVQESTSSPKSGNLSGMAGRIPAAPVASTSANRFLGRYASTVPSGAAPPAVLAKPDLIDRLPAPRARAALPSVVAQADKSIDFLDSSGNMADSQTKPTAQVAAAGTIGVQSGTAPSFPVQAQAVTGTTIGGVGLISDSDIPLSHPAPPAPVPQAEVETRANPFTTFSLNVSDVAFKLAAASLQNGVMPDAASMRSEEFINAFDYRDPEPAPGAPIGFSWELAADPFAPNRALLRFSIKTAAQGRPAGRRLNLVLLLDKSGSMERADRVEIISQALRVLASQLQPQDTLSVVVFARTARLWVDGVPGSQAGAVAGDLRALTPEGGTNLEEAMKLAYATALRHYLAEGENRVVLLTDGAANLCNVEPDALKQEVETNRKQGISFDCFGVGWDGYNDDLLETLSRAGNGRYAFINTPEEAATEFAGKLAGALQVAAADVKVQVEFNSDRVTSYRQIGYVKYQLTSEQFRDNSVTAAQIGAAESGNALYTVRINPTVGGPLDPAGGESLCTVRVRFRLPGASDYQEHEWIVPYPGGALPLEKASAAMRLAATAAAFSEWLAASPYAGEVTPDRLLIYLNGVPQAYGADARPAKLEWMIRQAKSISGK